MSSALEKFTAAEYEYLIGNRLGRIATTSARGVPDMAAVAYLMDGEDVVVGGSDLTKTIKYFNIRSTGLACFSVDDLKTVAKEKLAWLDGLVAGRQWIVGDRFTLADVLLFCFLEFGAEVGQPLDAANKNVTAWKDRVAARPSASAS